jgi:2-octaprenylphenol hydroxylase
MRISPFTHIAVWDAAKNADIQFDSRDIGESVLGFIIENTVMQVALAEKIKQYPQIQYIAPIKLAAWQSTDKCVTITAADERVFTAKLAVAADGAQSWLREQADIALSVKAYDQDAIVGTVYTAQPHAQQARQVFLESGPLAFLPLAHANASSIVWSLPSEEAKRLLAVDRETFLSELGCAFSHRLGEVLDVSQRFAFPLRKQQASHYVKARLALVGDAAHTIHPLAGQGVNMGLLDAASLTEVIVTAIKQRRDFASYATLRRYERWRRADNQTLLTGVDWIKQLFASDQTAMQVLRTFGLTITNQTQSLKNLFTCYAVGNRPQLPLLAKPSI